MQDRLKQLRKRTMAALREDIQIAIKFRDNLHNPTKNK